MLGRIEIHKKTKKNQKKKNTLRRVRIHQFVLHQAMIPSLVFIGSYETTIYELIGKVGPVAIELENLIGMMAALIDGVFRTTVLLV